VYSPSSIKKGKFKVMLYYPRATAMTNVMAGTRLPIALAIDDEAKYSPSAKTF
jgi:hypothetical protein